jgi:hypothetical protein
MIENIFRYSHIQILLGFTAVQSGYYEFFIDYIILESLSMCSEIYSTKHNYCCHYQSFHIRSRHGTDEFSGNLFTFVTSIRFACPSESMREPIWINQLISILQTKFFIAIQSDDNHLKRKYDNP